MERRKIIKRTGMENPYYESLKPSVFGENGRWEKHGRRYDIRGIDNLLRCRTFEFILDPEVGADLYIYRQMAESKKLVHQK
jgi:hypothetical protein